MNITIAGFGYVGLSNAILLGKHNSICIYDVDTEKVKNVNSRIFQCYDDDTQNELHTIEDIYATTDPVIAFSKTDLVIIAVPTNWNETQNVADMSIIETVIDTSTTINPKTCIVIRSTVELGFMDSLQEKYHIDVTNLFFMPEFLRESQLLSDTFNPSRFILGCSSDTPKEKIDNIISIFSRNCHIDKTKIFTMNYKEAEAIKLLSNAYLAMRVAYFNEVDTLAMANGLSTDAIIAGISADPRIGNYYNVPSFGFGGYCLPKDIEFLTHMVSRSDYPLLSNIARSNVARINTVTADIISSIKKTHTNKKNVAIGVYRLSMNGKTPDYRNSPTLKIMLQLWCNPDYTLLLYEPKITHIEQLQSMCTLCESLDELKNASDIIISDRYSSDLEDVKYKVYTRDKC